MRRRAAALLAVALVVGAGCGDRSDDATPTTSTEAHAEALPPASALDLDPVYGAALSDLGLELTSRGGLIDRTGGGYEPSSQGTHLALYVEPRGGRTTEEYIDGIASVAAVFGDVFERWPGLESYDVCQEPADAGAGDVPEPLPVTQIELTRSEAAAFDWSTTSTVDVVRASRREPPGLQLRVSPKLAVDPAYVAVVAEADR